ncbi:DUF1592 domain-containing protein [Rhodopirellula europaea]|uniref:Secreted protein containing DUF1588 n=1 Tax=Rhodopirellula europaea SH398 TaxID=1263868 RepID=M5S9W3_9BACT|nr:DUF1592 domain-containing protein [Rhodopirellula europaea]EMI28271.1 secreted protein containing DUF1588 [Rhodopirellula europaea SH398]
MRNPPLRCTEFAMFCVLTVLLTTQTASAFESDRSEPDASAKAAGTLETVLQSHCVKCHSAGEDPEGDIALSEINDRNVADDLDQLQSLIDVLDLEEMPPEDETQLPPETRRKLLAELKATLRGAVSHSKQYPRTPIRRMNRFQYNNAVVDLFDLNCTVFTLPERMLREHRGYFQPASGKMPDEVFVGSRPLGKSQMIEPRLAGVAAFPQDLRAEHGYDNQADHLSLSPLLMESFLKLGQSITESPDFVPANVGIWDSFFAAPTPESDLELIVRERLKSILTRAFRRSVDQSQLDRYSQYVLRNLEDGVAFPVAMKAVAAATISSPRFLYLYDLSSESPSVTPVDDYELASRLSFFLWGSIPDQTLLELAAEGRLREKDVLSEQFERMIRDRKLKRFCDSFPSQWLQLERIISSVPSPEEFPNFYFLKYRDSMHMMLEPLLLFETVLIENQPITQLIDSDFTYRSDLLEDAYGELAIQDNRNGRGVQVIRFRRLPIEDRRSGGVITNAAVMTMTSGPERTQPITRGAWLAGVVFNNPPEPPPADVPALGEKPAEGEEHLTLRERLSMHRKRSDCKGCHEQIDPLGFALENFNPVGVWRDQYENGRDVDMAGTLFRKHRFENVIEFKDALLSEKDRFTEALAGHLLSFALARPLSAADRVALGEITAKVASDEYKMHTLLRQVVLSEPFQTKSFPQIASNPRP